MHIDATIEYNNMIMLNKSTDYYFLSRPIVLEYITMTGYIKSDVLLKKAFEQAQGDQKAICYLLFNYPDTSMGVPRNQPFRYDMLNKMELNGRELLTDLPTINYVQYQLQENEYYKSLCYLLNPECSIQTDEASGVWMDYPFGGQTDLYFNRIPEIRLMFKIHKYCGLKYIQQFDKSYNILKITDFDMNGNHGGYKIYDYVTDSDGYVNVRKESSTSSEVIFKINQWEKVEILDEVESFYKIKYNDQEGFVHSSRFE
jgi:uncharacterized protein YgiM (DUF1202 family)